MNHLIAAARKSLEDENWFGALYIALTIPDIAARLETPSEGVGSRYRRWFAQWVQHKYEANPGTAGSPTVVFLHPEDCYALRCAILHQGDSDLTDKKRTVNHDMFDQIIFVVPEVGKNYSFNVFNSTLQLQVDVLVEDLCSSAVAWMKSIENDAKIQSRVKNLTQLHTFQSALRIV